MRYEAMLAGGQPLNRDYFKFEEKVNELGMIDRVLNF
jgi:hypothetical protein